jgi:TM2 domain-containing membrane protein YozV
MEGQPVPSVNEFASKKIAAGICGILLGSLGIHKFILGLNGAGIIMLVVTLVSLLIGSIAGAFSGGIGCICGFGGSIMSIIGLIEGIIYLTKSDDEFHRIYAIEKKEWF